ncbi:GntR family transcriptional regulator [Streptomyces sp. WMMC500]|uniref:GntR family transcriptional regulator n=1 Tax=Streptomyces sp. WMMC500 TaxID=3015154 RepID=UPI00248B8692|nr:GntR family transcriptional regulator [Streptomyces sp. WMMC500]WBB61284.1 GntR family transcriptional regulator [Streptomyces sp. WMMC500]
MTAISKVRETAALPASDEQKPLPGQNLPRLSSGEQVRLYVRRLVFDGYLTAGQKVPQDAIAEALGVSRIPVREALIVLEREGWVTMIPHRGAFVNALDENSVRDHYELYGMFYGFAVRRAVERQGADLAQRLKPIQEQIHKEKDADRLHELTLSFHRTVIDAARSPRLKTVVRQMTDIVPGNFFELVPGADALERDGTAAIVAAIERGYSEIAEREYGTMLRRQGDLVVGLFREKGLLDAEPAAESAG